MANIMTKRGNLDNIITYEHICDTTADMDNIDPHYITLGSICIVINSEDREMEVYMANSNKEWNSIAMGAGSSSGSASSLIDLLDVKVLNPTDGQTLVYSAEEGKWVNGGSGSTGGMMMIHATRHYDEEYDTTYYTADESFDEVVSFIENGGIPILVLSDGGIAQCDEIERDEESGNITQIDFGRIHVGNMIIRYLYSYMDENNSPFPNFITYDEFSFGPPSPPSSDDEIMPL